MKKIESLFITICLFAIITITGVAIWSALKPAEQGEPYKFPATKYGSFLAAQHAIYVNDFETAADLTKEQILAYSRLVKDLKPQETKVEKVSIKQMQEQEEAEAYDILMKKLKRL